MHRLMVTSSTYRQSSLANEERMQSDPDNRLLSRMPLRRMEAEVVRDTLLLVAGQLVERPHGPADGVQVRPDGLVLGGKRRSIYVQQLRKSPISLLESFDLPAMNPNCLSRSESLVAPQALHLLNDAGIRDLANGLAARVRREAGEDPARQIDKVYWITLSRPPALEELSDSQTTLQQLTAAWKSQLSTTGQPAPGEAEGKALATFCHAILNSAAFLYID